MNVQTAYKISTLLTCIRLEKRVLRAARWRTERESRGRRGGGGGGSASISWRRRVVRTVLLAASGSRQRRLLGAHRPQLTRTCCTVRRRRRRRAPVDRRPAACRPRGSGRGRGARHERLATALRNGVLVEHPTGHLHVLGRARHGLVERQTSVHVRLYSHTTHRITLFTVENVFLFLSRTYYSAY